MTRHGRHFRVELGGLALVGVACCFGFVAPPPAADPTPATPAAGMTANETQLVLSRLDAIDRQLGWMWLAVIGCGATGSAVGSHLAGRRRLTPTPTIDPRTRIGD